MTPERRAARPPAGVGGIGHSPMLSPIMARQIVPVDDEGASGLVSIPPPPRVRVNAGSLHTDDEPSGVSTPVGRTSRTRSLTVSSKTARPGSAPPQLALYHQQRPVTPPPTAALRPDSAPPARPREDLLRNVREVGVGRAAAPHTFGVVSAVNQTTMPPPPPAIYTGRSCCPWVGPRVISGERFKFDLALRRRCCYCEGICNGILMRRRLVQCSWGWRHYTGAALWRQGKGGTIRALVFVALITNLVALVATRKAMQRDGVVTTSTGTGLTALRLDSGWNAICVWLEVFSASVLMIEVLLQWTASSFLPWLLHPRHLLRVMLTAVVTASVFHQHVALRTVRPLLLLRVLDMLPILWFNALSASIAATAGQFLRITVALGLLLGLLTLSAMQLFGGVLRGRCLSPDLAAAYGWGVSSAPPLAMDSPDGLNSTAVAAPPHCLINWRIWTTLGVLELFILTLVFGTVSRHVKDLNRRSKKTRWRRSCAGGSLAFMLQGILTLAGWLWFRNQCAQPDDLPRHCLDNWRVWSVLAAAEVALLIALVATVVRRRRHGKNSVACCARIFFSLILQPVLVLSGIAWFRELCEARLAAPPLRHCADDWRAWAALGGAELLVLVLFFLVLRKREVRLERDREEHRQSSWVPNALAMVGVFLLQVAVVGGGLYWFIQQCASPESGEDSANWADTGSWSSVDSVDMSHKVVVVLTVNMEISECDEDFRTTTCSTLTSEALVAASQCTAWCMAGSVIVTAEIQAASSTVATNILSRLRPKLADAASASRFMGLDVETEPTLSVVRVATEPKLIAESWSSSGSDTGSWEESWSESESWSNATGSVRRLQFSSNGAGSQVDSSSSGSRTVPPLPPLESVALCDPYPSDLVNRCPGASVCVDVIALTGLPNGHSVPSFDDFYGAAVATAYVVLTPGWTNFYRTVSTASHTGFVASIFGCICAAAGVIIIANVQLATVKTPVSAAISRVAIAAKRSELALLRKRVLGSEGHRAIRRTFIKTSMLELAISCCTLVTPTSLKRMRHRLRMVVHDGRYQSWMTVCTVVNTVVIASTHSGMAAHQRSIQNGLIFYLNLMFLTESVLKTVDISPDPFAKDQYNRGPARYLSSFDIIDLSAAIMVFSVPSGPDENVPMYALGALRCLRLVWFCATTWLPQAMVPLRTATAILIQSVLPLVTIWVLLSLVGLVFLLVGWELLPATRFGSLYNSVFLLLQAMNLEEIPDVLGSLLDKTTDGNIPDLRASCFLLSWTLVANGLVFSMLVASLADAGERVRHQESKLQRKTVVAPTDQFAQRPESASSSHPTGMIVKPDDVLRMLLAFGQDVTKPQVEHFFSRVCEAGQPLRLPTLLAQLEVDAAVADEHVKRAPTVHLVRNMLRAVRVLAIIDVIVEIWLWLGISCLRAGAPFDCWVPTSSPSSPVDRPELLIAGIFDYPKTSWDALLLCVTRSLVVTYAATRPRRLFGISGVLCDLQVVYLAFKIWKGSEIDSPAADGEFWWMLGIGLGVALIYRLCACIFVYIDSSHAVAPRSIPAVDCLVSSDRATELVAAVRFFSVCDSAGKGHVTEVELRRMLRALNGGERGTDDVRFDAAFLARDLMHQMDSVVDGKVYLHEFLQHASSGKNTPLTRLLLSKQMVRVLTAFTVADSNGDRVLERSQLGRFFAGTGLHMSEDDLDEIFLQVELDHSGRVDLFELLGFLTATRELPFIDAVPPVWATSPSKLGSDPVQILKIHHEEEDLQYPEPQRPKVTFAVPLDPRYVPTRNDEPEQLLPSLARGTRPFLRPCTAAPYEKPKPDTRWRPSTAPSAVLGSSAYNLRLTEWFQDIKGDAGRSELIESAMRKIYDKCDHSAQKAMSLFAEIDVDASGELDYDEFEQFLRRMGVVLSEQQVQWLIEELDRDGDGNISSAEFMALVFKDKGTLSAMVDGALAKIFEQLGGMDAKPKAAQVFREIDKDDSGEISYEELEDALKLLNVKLSIAQLDGVIQSLDQDGDGSISVKEFVDGVFGARHASAQEKLDAGNSFMRVTVLEAKLKHATDTLKYCLANLGGFPEGTNEDMAVGIAKQTGLSEPRPLDISQMAKDRFNRAPKWKVDERTKKPKGYTLVFEPEWTPASLEIQCFGGKGNTGDDQQIGQGSMDLDGLKTFLEWKNDEWVPLLDANKKYAGRVRVKVSWHPYVPPEPEPEPVVAAVKPWAKMMLRIKKGWGFAGEVGEDPVELVPYCIAVIEDEQAQATVRQKSAILPCDTTGDQLFWRTPQGGTEDLWFELAGIPQRIEVRLMHCTHDIDEDTSTDPDRTLGHGFVILADLASELPEDKIWSKETEMVFRRQTGEDQDSECGTLSVQVVWDPIQHEEEVVSDDEGWPTRRLRATVLGVRGLPETQADTSLFVSFTCESMGADITKMTGQTEPGSGTERDFPENTRVDFPARRVPKELQIILMDDSQGEIGSCISTSLLDGLPREERWSKEEWVTLASSLGHECELRVHFHWEIEPHLVPDLPRILRITILSGRQLAKAERYGENDPYVKVTVLGKTQQTETVHEGGSMPAFADGKGEAFDWEVSDLKRAAKIKLECFDDDIASKDDEIGTGTIELGTTEFSRMKPPWSKSVWTQLRDNGGRGQNETGQIHTLIQYWDPTHHEPPKPLPLKRLRVTILSASKLPKMDLFGENDPYIVLNVDGVKKRTTTMEGAGSSPAWGYGIGERFEFFCLEMPAFLRLQAYDEDIGSADDLIGSVDHTMDSHDPNEIWSEDTWVHLTNPDGKGAGKIHCLLRWSPDPENDVEADKPAKRLVVTVMSAFRLPKSDIIGKNDPYVIVMADDSEKRTPTVDDGGTNVEWDAPHGIRLEFPFAEGQLPSMLKFRVMDEDVGSSDDEIGFCHFSLLDHGLQEHCWSRDESMYLSATKNGKANKLRARLNVKIAIEEEIMEEVVEEEVVEADKPVDRRLEITVINAEHLPSMDMFSENDVYCTVQVGDIILRTTTINDGGADPFWHGGSGEVLYLSKKVPPQVLDLKVWDCDKDEPTNWLTATVYDAQDLPKADTFGKNDPYALLTVDGQIQRTPTIENGGANVEWGTVLKWQLDSLPQKVDVVVMDADTGSKDDFICGGEFAFVDVKMGRGMIPGVSTDQAWDKEWSVQMYKKDGKSIFKSKRQPRIRVHFKWEPNVVNDDFIGSAMVPLGSSLLADQDWSLERATSIFNEKGQPAGTVHMRVRWNTDPASEPMLMYGENDNSPQGKNSRPEPEPEPEPENDQSQAKVLSSGKAGTSVPASVAKAMREAELKRAPDNRNRIPKDDLGFEMETRPVSAMLPARKPPPRDTRQAGYDELMTYIEEVDVNGVPAGPRQIRPTSAATYAPVVHTEIIVDDDAQVLNPSVVVLAAIESVVTITSEQSGVHNPSTAAVPWRSLAKLGPALSEARSRLRAAQRWHVVQMYGTDADAVELHRKRYGLSLIEIVRKQRHQYRETLQPYQFTKPSFDWPSLVGGSSALLCRLITVGELTASIFMYLAMLCLGNGARSNCWATSGGDTDKLSKPEWDSYSGGGIAGTSTDTLVLCAVRTAFVLHGPSNPYSLRVAVVACCVGLLFSLFKMIAHLAASDPPTTLHLSLFLLALLTPLCQLGLLYSTYWSAKKWSIKLRKAPATDPLQEERERVQALDDHSHYKFERFPVWCGTVTMDPRFEKATLCVVGITVVIVALRGQNLKEEVDKPLSTAYICCVAFFCVELVLRAATFGLLSWAKKHEHQVDGALMPQPLLHTGRGLIDTLVLIVAIGHLFMQSLAQNDVQPENFALVQPMAPTLLTFRLVTAWWLPHLRCHSVRVRSATVVVHAWRRLLGIAAVLLIPTAVFAMLGTAEFGGAMHRCVRGGGFADSRAGAEAELFGSADSCEEAATSFKDTQNITWASASLAADVADSSSGSWNVALRPQARSVCAWVALDRVASKNTTDCTGSAFARWSNDIVNFDSFGRSVVTLLLTSHQGWFRLGVMLMQSAGSSTRQVNTTVLLPPNVAVDDTWPPREPRTAVFFLLLGTSLNVLLARLWLAVIWTETDNWERQESVKGDGRLPFQTERRSIRRRVGTRLANLLRIPELELDLDSSESEEEDADSVYSSNEEEVEPEPDISVPQPDSIPMEDVAADQSNEEHTATEQSRCQTCRSKLSCRRCNSDTGDKYAIHSSLSLSMLDNSSMVMPLPSDPPKEHDRRFIRELSKYAELHSRISSFGDEPDLEQLTYAFSDEELRLVMRMNQLLVFEYVRDPKTGEYTMEEKSKAHKVAILHSNLHKLRPAGELRKSASGSFFERWPEVRPSTAEAKIQEQSMARGAEVAKPRFCCNSECLLRYLRSVTLGVAIVETGMLCLAQFGRDRAVDRLSSTGSVVVTLLLLADSGLVLVRRLLCCQWKAASRAAVAFLLPAIACADLLVQHLAISSANSVPDDERAYIPVGVVLPEPRTALVALVLLQIGHRLSPPGYNPQAGWLCGIPRRLIDSAVAQAKALQTVFDAIIAGMLAAFPMFVFSSCFVLAYASLSTGLFGHLWVAAGEPATALLLNVNGGADSASSRLASHTPTPSRFSSTSEAMTTLSSLAFGAPSIQLYSGLVWASCDEVTRIHDPGDCRFGWIAVFLLSFLFVARLLLLGVACVFSHRYRTVYGVSTAAEEALRHVDVWCEAWHKLLHKGSTIPGADSSEGRRVCGGGGIGCCASAASPPALLGTTLPCASLVELLLSVPPPLGVAGTADATHAVRELLLGLEGLELRTVDENAREDDENGNGGGAEALEFGCVLLAAVERAARTNCAVGRSAAHAMSGKKALRQAFAVFFHDMAREKTFKDARELRAAQEAYKQDSIATQGLRSSRPPSALKRPGSATIGRPGSGIGRTVAGRPNSGSAKRPMSALKRPQNGARVRPISASSRPNSAASSRSDAGAARPVSASATMRPGSAGLGRLRPLSAQRRAVSAGAKRRAGSPRRVMLSDLDA